MSGRITQKMILPYIITDFHFSSTINPTHLIIGQHSKMGQCLYSDHTKNTTLFEMGEYGILKASSRLRRTIEKFPILKDFGFHGGEKYLLEFEIITDHEFWASIDLSKEVDPNILRQRVITKIIEVFMDDGLLKNKDEFLTEFNLAELIFDRQPLIKIQTKQEYDQLSDKEQRRVIRCNHRVITVGEHRMTFSFITRIALGKIRGIISYGIDLCNRVHVNINIISTDKYWENYDLSNVNTRMQIVKDFIAQQFVTAGVLKKITEIDIYFQLSLTFNISIHHYID